MGLEFGCSLVVATVFPYLKSEDMGGGGAISY